MRKFTLVAVAASAGALLTAARRRRNKDEIDLWREATSAQGNR
ncbi:DLW-39 family protein [Parafrankia sp. FMc2]